MNVRGKGAGGTVVVLELGPARRRQHEIGALAVAALPVHPRTVAGDERVAQQLAGVDVPARAGALGKIEGDSEIADLDRPGPRVGQRQRPLERVAGEREGLIHRQIGGRDQLGLRSDAPLGQADRRLRGDGDFDPHRHRLHGCEVDGREDIGLAGIRRRRGHGLPLAPILIEQAPRRGRSDPEHFGSREFFLRGKGELHPLRRTARSRPREQRHIESRPQRAGTRTSPATSGRSSGDRHESVVQRPEPGGADRGARRAPGGERRQPRPERVANRPASG